MDVEMDAYPSCHDPEDINIREHFRRYRQRQTSISPCQGSSGSRFTESGKLYSVQSMYGLPKASLLENIKQDMEVESPNAEFLDGSERVQYAFKRRSPVGARGPSVVDITPDSVPRARSYSLNYCKQEDETLEDNSESTFALFASFLVSSLQGSITIPELILQFEKICRNASESIRYGSNVTHHAAEDTIMRQTAHFLLDEAASWSLLWYLYGKGNDEFPDDLLLSPSTSHLEACQFVATDHTAQLCFRIVEWLEDLSSKALDLDKKVRGSHVGIYLSTSGIWQHTQRFLKKGVSNTNSIKHLDFDAPTREHAQLLPDDKKQEESLLEDIWTLIKSGRLEEACNLCRSAGQPWRAASLCPFGGLDQSLSIEALARNGKNRTLQAIELESGIGHQWHLWKWASYCASEKIAQQDSGKYEAAVYAAQCSNLKRMLTVCTDWESACWAMAKSWLDVLVDIEVARLQPGRMELFKSYEDTIDCTSVQTGTASQLVGPENWPLQVLNQQPRHISNLLQKLHSSDTVHEAVARACKEQHRQIEMNLMVGDVPRLLELIWSWISPTEDDQTFIRPHGDPQMMRFGAHLVLVFRYLFEDQMKDTFKEKIASVGDRIINMYAMFLFSKKREELVGVYASQLAGHHCIDLFVHMMELRLDASVEVKHKIFLSAMEFLPFSPRVDSKGSFEEIIDRVLSRSREIEFSKYDESADVAEQHRLLSLQKAMVVQWLCFTPPSTVNDFKVVISKLLLRALIHSNMLFREIALISMWRIPAMPAGAHKLLSLLAEPLEQPIDIIFSSDDLVFSENFREFRDWSEYYSCDAMYRNWLKIEVENAEISPLELSEEENQRAIAAAEETFSASFSLLSRKENAWLIPTQDCVYEPVEPVYLELHATAVLCLPSGECMRPDATVCSTLMSALYASASEDVLLSRELVVNVSISSRNNYCIDILLRCLATEGDGLGLHDLNDGGILANVIAAGFKGELVRFQAGVAIEISRLDAWYSSKDGSLEGPATYILMGLCRRCCLPELILRCMQVSVSLASSGNPPENHHKLVELVACPETQFLNLFSQNQLQEFLLFEREYTICQMELREDLSSRFQDRS